MGDSSEIGWTHPHARSALSMTQPQIGGDLVPLKLKDRAGADPNEWPEELKVQEFPTPRTR